MPLAVNNNSLKVNYKQYLFLLYSYKPYLALAFLVLGTPNPELCFFLFIYFAIPDLPSKKFIMF